MALKLLGSAPSGTSDAVNLGYFAYSEIALAASTTVVASNNLAIQNTGWSTVTTGSGHTPGSSGITVPAGIYLVTTEVAWNTGITFVRYPAIYDGSVYHFADTQGQVGSSGNIQTFQCLLRLTSSTLVQTAYQVSTTSTTYRVTTSSSTATRMGIQRLS